MNTKEMNNKVYRFRVPIGVLIYAKNRNLNIEDEIKKEVNKRIASEDIGIFKKIELKSVMKKFIKMIGNEQDEFCSHVGNFLIRASTNDCYVNFLLSEEK